MKKGFDFLKNIVWLTQLGLSIAAPLVLSVLAAVWLRGRFGLGGWVVAVGAVVGIGAAFVSLWQNLKAMDRQARADDRDSGTSYNDHR